jgi:hypothetical protein
MDSWLNYWEIPILKNGPHGRILVQNSEIFGTLTQLVKRSKKATERVMQHDVTTVTNWWVTEDSSPYQPK